MAPRRRQHIPVAVRHISVGLGLPACGSTQKESQRSSEAMIASPREDHGGATTLSAVMIIGQKRILEERENILFRKHDFG